ncbi:MAG: hypothetical protein RMN51_02980 [Verrucomicrobiota bacterium]|nr:hypothetical protein [Limisphaera sp.]MDW8381063.1 hypothetical protein [Verrucomicrobiota bacterium]
MKSEVLNSPVSVASARVRASKRSNRPRWSTTKDRLALKWWCVARADEWFAMGELGAARDFLQHAAALDPKDPCVWLALGSVRYLLGELAESGLAFLRAIRLRPQEARAWLHLAIVHERMGQPGLALMLAGQARELDPADEAVRVTYARLHRLVATRCSFPSQSVEPD